MVPRTSNHVYKGWQGVAVCWLNDVGVSDDRLIVNTPGNPKAVGESLEALHAVLPHCFTLIRGRKKPVS